MWLKGHVLSFAEASLAAINRLTREIDRKTWTPEIQNFPSCFPVFSD